MTVADPESLAQVAVSDDPLANRVSYEGAIDFDAEGLPLNPRGRTGMRGRGYLFRWGANHASDPIVVRCLPGGRYQILTKPRKRLDDKTASGDKAPDEDASPMRDWLALPGQMAQPGMFFGSRLKDFLLDEFHGDPNALRQLLSPTDGTDGRRASAPMPSSAPADASLAEESQADVRRAVDVLDEEASLSPGRQRSASRKADRPSLFDDWGIYRGYVDEERNTDNAWVETVAILIRIDPKLAQTMRSCPQHEDDEGTGAPAGSRTLKDMPRNGGFQWVDLCWKGDPEVDEPDSDPVLKRFFPGHRGWVWCARNYFAGGMQPNSLVSPEAARFLKQGELEGVDTGRHKSMADVAELLGGAGRSPKGEVKPASKVRWHALAQETKSQRVYSHQDANRQVRRQLHLLAQYRHLVTVFSVPLTDQGKWNADLERRADEFKEALLQAMLDTFRRAAKQTAAKQSILKSSGSRSRGTDMDEDAAATFRPVRRVSALLDDTPGILQLLVRWGMPHLAADILTEQELAAERTPTKLQHALQVVLERGDEKFLETLLTHASQRALAEPECKPAVLVSQLNLQRLYHPDRVRRRDLAASGDAFKLFKDIQGHVNRERRAAVRQRTGDELDADDESRLLDTAWWKWIDRRMRLFVDGYNFDKSPNTRAAQRRSVMVRGRKSIHQSMAPAPSASTTLGAALGSTSFTKQRAFSRQRAQADRKSNSALHYASSAEEVTFTDLFFWALASGQPQMVQVLWSRVQEPLRCAVVGVEACRRIYKKYFTRGRGKANSKRLLEMIQARLEEGLVGILENISRPQAARTILIETTSCLGLKRGTCNLLKLGIRLRSRKLVAHDLSQGVLEAQWRGRDAACGSVALKVGATWLPLPS